MLVATTNESPNTPPAPLVHSGKVLVVPVPVTVPPPPPPAGTHCTPYPVPNEDNTCPAVPTLPVISIISASNSKSANVIFLISGSVSTSN